MNNDTSKAELVLANTSNKTEYYECSNCYETCVGKSKEDARHISEIFPRCDYCGAEMIKIK